MKKTLFFLFMIFQTVFIACGNIGGVQDNESPGTEEVKGLGSHTIAHNASKDEDDNKKEAEWVVISDFCTPLLDKSKPRIHNIALVAEILDGLVISPNESFSFNETVGERSSEKGYKEAPIMIPSSEKPVTSYDYGGGVCQVSGTLYNTVKKAGLKITERHPHSRKVPYLDKGMDATVDYGRFDLKFINTLKHPVRIAIAIEKDTLTVSVSTRKN